MSIWHFTAASFWQSTTTTAPFKDWYFRDRKFSGCTAMSALYFICTYTRRSFKNTRKGCTIPQIGPLVNEVQHSIDTLFLSLFSEFVTMMTSKWRTIMTSHFTVLCYHDIITVDRITHEHEKSDYTGKCPWEPTPSQEAFLGHWWVQTLESRLCIGIFNGKSGLPDPDLPAFQKCLLWYSHVRKAFVHLHGRKILSRSSLLTLMCMHFVGARYWDNISHVYEKGFLGFARCPWRDSPHKNTGNNWTDTCWKKNKFTNAEMTGTSCFLWPDPILILCPDIDMCPSFIFIRREGFCNVAEGGGAVTDPANCIRGALILIFSRRFAISALRIWKIAFQ